MISVAIVEDRNEIREGIQSLIAGTDGFRCTGAWGSMEEALAGMRSAAPDVALVDIGLPGMTGIKGIRLLRQRHASTVCLVLTVYHDDERIFEALCAGACGYLLKKTPSSRLLESIVEAAGGGAPMSPEVARRVVSLFRDFAPPAQADYNLTPHEIRVLGLLVEGHNYKTAAAELKVATPTVAFHLRRIYEKLQVHSKSEAVAKALRAGIIR
jgi:DNA-binding NarL/FixJ family response regulator